MVTAATAKVSDDLFAQLTEGGVLVAPVGQPGCQQLYRYVRHGEKLDRSNLGGVSFVPLLPGISQ
jgi:protein-L-isoaspartate(D-aspartate) O-methyltransferase